MTPPYEPGQTGLVLEVPVVDAALQAVRAEHDPALALGAPAHVTVLFPWLARGAVDDAVLADLAGVLRGHRAVELAFRRTGRFPGVLHLLPEPEEPCRALTRAVAERWPDFPPYGGEFPDPQPHLTIAQGPDPVLDAAERTVRGALPLRARVDAVSLLAFDGARWRRGARLPLPGSELPSPP